MKISEIIPCLNSEKYIEETIESVLNLSGDAGSAKILFIPEELRDPTSGPLKLNI